MSSAMAVGALWMSAHQRRTSGVRAVVDASPFVSCYWRSWLDPQQCSNRAALITGLPSMGVEVTGVPQRHVGPAATADPRASGGHGCQSGACTSPRNVTALLAASGLRTPSLYSQTSCCDIRATGSTANAADEGSPLRCWSAGPSLLRLMSWLMGPKPGLVRRGSCGLRPAVAERGLVAGQRRRPMSQAPNATGSQRR
jgi:hypothetical protein